MKNRNYEYNKVTKINSIRDILKGAVEEAGDKLAFRYREDKVVHDVTYKEFMQDCNNLGTALYDLGLEKEHIAVIGENCYDWATVFLTVLMSTGVIVPVDKELKVEEIINVLKRSDSTVFFYTKRYEKHIEQIEKEVPNIKYFICFKEEEDNGKFLSYSKLKEKGAQSIKNGNTKYIESESDKNALKMLVYTSGTTGLAKGVMLSEHNLVTCVYYGLQVSTVYTRCLSVLPYHHTYEAVGGLLVSMHKHATICINENLKMVLKNLQFYKPDYVYLVPAFAEAFYKKIWENARENKKDKALSMMIKVSNCLLKVGIDLRRVLFKQIHESFGGNLIKIVCGGAPIRPELGQFFEDIGFCLVNGYGITECSPLVSANRDYFNDCSTVGVVLPCLDIKFENVTEDGEGEICVKGDNVMLGYYKDEERTKEVLKNGWFNTGDYGKMNDKGQLLITGRKKNLIVLKNGKNVFPEEIENYIGAIDYIVEVVVRGIKDENNSEVGLSAEVYLDKEMLDEKDDDKIYEKVKKDIHEATMGLPVYKHISELIIRDTEFEKTTTNKIKR